VKNHDFTQKIHIFSNFRIKNESFFFKDISVIRNVTCSSLLNYTQKIKYREISHTILGRIKRSCGI
jgi:hypothetical protein